MPASEGHQVLVCAPYGSDASSVAQLLRREGYDAHTCPTLTAVAEAIDDRIGVILLTEEALATDLTPLDKALEAQPAWSDIPFVLLARRQAGRAVRTEAIRRRLPNSAINVVLLERPLSSESLISAIASAGRARQKQFEIRDQLATMASERTRLETLVNYLPVGVAFVNPDGSTRLSNPEFRRFLPTAERPSRQLDGEAQWEGYETDGSRIKRDRFVTVRALHGEHVAGIEFRHHPDCGDPVWTRVSGIPLRNGDEITGAISVIVDIDEQKRGQIELAQAAGKLEQQVAERTEALREALGRLEAEERERAEAALRQSQKMEAVGQLTGGIAHDFNNMLTGVIGSIDIMKRRIASGRVEDLERFMEAAITSAQRAAGLTSRLLAFSRRQSLDSKPTDVDALVGSLEDLLKRTMSEQIRVIIRRTPDLPAAIVDANQLESAILNLAINARDAMPLGGVLTVATDAATLDATYCAEHPGIKPGQYIVVTVSDTGVGMDEGTLEKVFEPFFTTKPIGQGTGLGLSMVYGFAKQSNGQVRIRSTPNQGTALEIFLPVADRAAVIDNQQPFEILQGEGQSVLLVEDDASVRMLICDVLEELGYQSIQAADSEAAVKALASDRSFDLMVTDVGLPGMNGRQLAEVARAYRPELPILFVTGYAENAAIRSGFLGSNMQMITKPFQIDQLSAKISEMLS